MKSKEQKQAQPITSNIQVQDTSSIDYYINYNKKLLFKFPDNSVYYGYISYLDEYGNVINNVDSLSSELKRKLKIVRHGEGTQIFDFNENTSQYSYKYEGEWVKDRITGEGKIEYSNEDLYQGGFIDGKFEGKGVFLWKGKDKYEGDWKNGKMEGKGVFYHRDGFELKGNFLSNYFIDERNIFIDPFTPKEMIDVFKKKSYDNIISKQLKIDRFSIKNISIIRHESINEDIESCFRLRNKVPLVIRSSNSIISTKKEIFSFLNKAYEELDLRAFYMKLEDKVNFKKAEIYNEIQSIVINTMLNGKYLVLNFDNNKVLYNKTYDVNIKEFYGKKMLSSFMFNPELFFSHTCWFNHLNKEYSRMNKKFRYFLVSKIILESSQSENDWVNIIEKRFENVLPLDSIHVYILD